MLDPTGYNQEGEFWTDYCAPNRAWEDFSSEDREALSYGVVELCSDNRLP